MKDIVKNLTFQEHEINSICEAIILAQNAIGDRLTNQHNDWDNELRQKIKALDSILKTIYTTEYKELPQPPETEDNSLCSDFEQSLPYIEP